MRTDRRRAIGLAGERAAAAWLRRKGFDVVAQNARTRYGEIDLVARDGATWVFIEVKARSGSAFGHPLEAVDARKRLRLTRLAAAFMYTRGIDSVDARFDAIAVYVTEAGDVRVVEHVQDAFGAMR